MKKLPGTRSIRTAKAYDDLVKALYGGVKRRVEEIDIPPVKVIAVTGNQPPASQQYQDAIGALYGIGYTLKMGLKFGKISRPAGYFDYKVGGLETLWWSTGKTLEIANSRTLRWQAYLMVPAFMTKKLVDEARKIAKAKKPEVAYEDVKLDTVKEGRSVQTLHVGPYSMEGPTIELLLRHIADQGLAVNGKHHEIYISDPRRTAPDKLKTVIRYPVKALIRPNTRRGRAPTRA